LLDRGWNGAAPRTGHVRQLAWRSIRVMHRSRFPSFSTAVGSPRPGRGRRFPVPPVPCGRPA